MELVKGVPITEYCDAHYLTPRERLELFVPVCRAIQHAHQKGIIHRDIKPSNVLVTEYDDKPIAKVIDFGIAKAIEHRLTEKTMFTEFGQILGTFEYMSPEQAKLNQWDVDTRTDIYSLGVLLYELLSGEVPFDRQRLRSAAIDELFRIIREEDPPRPSTRLSTSDSLPTIAANRKTEPKNLGALIHGELDWIVMKALEKDRTRRYETANKVAEDIGHYLNDEPVEACPPSAAYRLRKFARRNKPVIGSLAAVAAALLIGIALAIWQAHRAIEQRGIAESNELQAKAEADKANSLVNLLKDMLLTANPANASLENLMDRFAPTLPSRLKDQPEVEIELQRILGSTYRKLGSYDEAEKHLHRALALERELRGGEQLESAWLLHEIALSRWEENHDFEIYPLLNQALAIHRMHENLHGETIARQSKMVPLAYQGRHEEAKQEGIELLEFMDRNQLAEPNMRLLINIHLSQIASSLGEDEAANSFAEQAIRITESQPEIFAKAKWHVHLHLGEILLSRGDYDEAEALFRRGLEVARGVTKEDNHRVRMHKFYLMEVLKAKRNPGSKAEIKELESSFKPHLLARTLRYRSLFAIRCYRDVRQSLDWARRAIAIESKARFANQIAWWAATHPKSSFRESDVGAQFAKLAVEAQPEVGSYWNTLGVAYYRAGNPDEAIQALNKSIELRDGGDAIDWLFLAMAHWQLGDEEESRKWYEKSEEWMTEKQSQNKQFQSFLAEAEKLLESDAIQLPDSKTEN